MSCYKNAGCVLCRYLIDDEKEMFENPHSIYDYTNESLTNSSANIIGSAVVIITDKAKCIEETDRIIESYQKAFDTLPKILADIN